MLSGHRSAGRRRGRNSRAARIAVPLAIPMALGLTLGIILAVSSGSHNHDQSVGSGGGSCASASASASSAASAGATTASAAPAPAASASASGDPRPPQCRRRLSFANGPIATRQLGNLATDPVDGTGAAINLNQTAAQAAASMNCTLTVPARPLTAQGLATPWQLGDGCSMANAGTEGAFVEATILAPNGQAAGLQPAGHHGGHHAGRMPAAPTIARGLAGDHRCRLQRHQPGARRPRRAARQLCRRARPVRHRPGVGVQRRQLLQPR